MEIDCVDGPEELYMKQTSVSFFSEAPQYDEGGKSTGNCTLVMKIETRQQPVQVAFEPSSKPLSVLFAWTAYFGLDSYCEATESEE